MHVQTNTDRTFQPSEAWASQVQAIVEVANAMEGAVGTPAGSTESTSACVREH
jgi:hypothetical protein